MTGGGAIVPAPLRERSLRSPGGRAWLESVPTVFAERCADWGLTPELPPGRPGFAGMWAVVVPVRRRSERLALKLVRPHPEAALEPVALRLWDGAGAVRLVDADPASGALLLERLDPGRRLEDVPFPEAAAVWGALVRRLSIPEDARAEWARLERIDARAEHWSDELPERWERLGRPFPRWLLEAALDVCATRGVVGRRGGRDVLVHTDLHGMNILGVLGGADRAVPGGPDAGFRAIDPQVAVGEAEYAVAPMLWNRLGELPEHGAPEALAERCRLLAAEAGLDAEAAREWAVLREVENALGYAEGPGHREDLERSLWVASALTGRLLPGLPGARDLAPLG
ncbi:aminoglycoside phosphotransferase family protein [Sinomonas mesophila]|uniref:aminoglycoside phosphotransferase family protein n=1 Tax=Sinomonas mesophila TaxID=1531955 RepID=UPI00098616C4|nr:aminoglycoside phosphotransferase family protein [Sinomonas mesophila]